MGAGRRWAAWAVAVALAGAACSSGGGGSGVVGSRSAAPTTTSAAAVPSTVAVVTAGGYGAPVKLGDLGDPAVKESSGLAASRRNPGRLWTHNDSGDGPLVYCLERSGASCGVWRVEG
ncbi:MAG: hypothetical protein ACRD0D_04255, partial [Acidimicrobiales bacterium]